MRLIGAFCLLLAILAIAYFGPGGTVGAVLYAISPSLLANMQIGIQRNLSPGLWSNIIHPLTLTPAWLPPLLVGVVFFLVGVGSQHRR
jgi:hypothetical protein